MKDKEKDAPCPFCGADTKGSSKKPYCSKECDMRARE